jgi:hypothetical protein
MSEFYSNSNLRNSLLLFVLIQKVTKKIKASDFSGNCFCGQRLALQLAFGSNSNALFCKMRARLISLTFTTILDPEKSAGRQTVVPMLCALCSAP